jgi:erythronate-4-phosphate dehydrogenase
LSPDQLQGVDVLLVRSVTRVDAELLDRFAPVFVGSATSGIDHVDQAALRDRRIGFAYAPGSNADSVVDYVLSVLSLGDDKLAALTRGADFGIIGYGHIGRRLHARLQALGINCKAYDPWLAMADYPALTSLESVLACPVVSVHAALTRSAPWPSYHMLDAALLRQLPAGALFINAGRGELLATEELLALHRTRPDVALALDVWEQEPSVDVDLLAACRFGTAHIAGYSLDGKLRATWMLYQAACQHLGLDVAAAELRDPPVSIEVPCNLEGVELMSWLVRQVYDIRDDDRLLRNAVRECDPGGFDRLRKTYRQRRELSRLRPDNLAELSPAARQVCIELGCEVSSC